MGFFTLWRSIYLPRSGFERYTHSGWAHGIMSRYDFLALVFSLLAVVASALVTQGVFEGIPHIEDEVAYVWQAKLAAAGELKISSPPHPKSYLVPFVVDYEGERFSKYPPGWPVILSIGIRLGLRQWVNPFLAGAAVWLTYRLGKRAFSDVVGLLAAGLTLSSPFFLMNSGSLLSHPLGLALSALFALSWLGAFGERMPAKGWLYTLGAAISLGMLILTRPFTAAAVSLPFACHALVLMVRGDKSTRLRLIVLGLILAGFLGLYLLWQYVLTGEALLNPYTLWWSYDRIGFGPGHGHTPEGHTLEKAYLNTKFSLKAGASDLFGWGRYSWIFLPFGLWAVRRNFKALLLSSVFLSLVVAYMAYWIGSWLFGPRYFYEGLFCLTLLSGAGIAWLAGWPVNPGEVWVKPARRPPEGKASGWRPFQGWTWPMVRPWLVIGGLTVLLSINLAYYLPIRLEGMRGLYGIEGADLQPFLQAETQQYAPALIVVHADRWMGYGAFLDLEDPFLSTPFIFAWNIGPETDSELAQDFPEREVYHYYLDTPYVFYTAPRPEP